MRVDREAQFRRDTGGMTSWYPQFTLVVPLWGDPYWKGILRPFRTRLETYTVLLVYPPEPLGIPAVWVTDPEISKRTHPFHPHINNDGSICTFFVPDRTYDPAVDDISRLVDLAGDWLRRFTFYEHAGWWPGQEAPHDARDVLRELEHKPAVPCVCGSGRSFRACCRKLYLATASHPAQPQQRSRSEAAGRRQLARTLRTVRTSLGAVEFARMLPHRGPSAKLLQVGIAGSIGAPRES